MKSIPHWQAMFRVAACLALIWFSVGATEAQNRIDLNRATCKQFLEMRRDHTLIVLGWLQGYYLEEHADPVVDLEKLFADLLRLTEHCEGRPDEELMTAAEELFGR